MIPARYHDGLTSAVHHVALSYERGAGDGTLLIHPAGSDDVLVRWAAKNLVQIPARAGQLRLGATDAPDGARLVIETENDIARILATLPVLRERQRVESGRQFRLAILSTLALASVILAYVFFVPLLASRVVHLIPPGWEEGIGATVADQVEASLGGDDGLPLCDPDPQSLANRAIARFAAEALAETTSPFTLDIRVVRSDIPNAFAIPGGRIYFHSALLNAARTPDEFAGVLAHEIGHIAYRHGMEQLVSTAGTGALIGFILGDLTGISVAAGLGATIIDARFSREAEHEADRFAALVSQRLDYQPAGFAALIARVSQDDAFSRALALLNTHPLTDDRRIALEALSRERPTGLAPPFTAAEWEAIRTMCQPPVAKVKRP
ncbi:MAG: M48 family metallopeptidase [Devosia sp.]|uniref:M48 family metallopeptidase n=1 Tax=unclassified Devosia TaxID=196773 RepID=UPI0019F0CF6E|nr:MULTISPECIES: M48 family metallopeptidase [unclassified Devosia]MBF0680975.1 M48 family metallopeptidase [Devosia sp.]WEJ32636.1 M48 family metallopeptidase [Devosia sp. SD17-2]